MISNGIANLVDRLEDHALLQQNLLNQKRKVVQHIISIVNVK